MHGGRQRPHALTPRLPECGREGHPTQETVLIENGILKGYLSDKFVAPHGNGRHRQRSSRKLSAYSHAADDQHLHARRARHPRRHHRSVKHGLYAVNFGGGQVDITNGKFVFSATEAYMIEDGKVTGRSRARR